MKKTNLKMSVSPLPGRIADELDRFIIGSRRRRSVISLSLLLFTGAVCCGCGPAPADGMNVRKTEFKIRSVPNAQLGYTADTSHSRRNEAHEKICENWKRDLILGRGTLLCTEPQE